MKKALILACIASAAVYGCKSAPVTESGSGGATPAQGIPASSVDSQKPTAPPSVPDELKTDAYHWYGLANSTPMKVAVSITGQPETDGTQTVKLKTIQNGKATFEIERPGQLGTETVSLEKDGIYTIGSTLIEGPTRNLEMPSAVPPGATWKNEGKVKMTPEVDQNLTIRVVGPQKVTTKAGTEDALLVKQTGTLAVGGVKYGIDSSIWYVRDKGMVKSVATMRDTAHPKDPPKVVSIQETK